MIDCTFENGAPAKLRHCVVDILIFNENKSQILLVKRGAKLIASPGKWALPGGYADINETLQQAAEREVLEETGHELSEVKFLKFNDNPERNGDLDRQNIAFVYSSIASEKVQEPDDESDEVKWFDLEQLPNEKDFAFDHFEIIKENT